MILNVMQLKGKSGLMSLFWEIRSKNVLVNGEVDVCLGGGFFNSSRSLAIDNLSVINWYESEAVISSS